MPVIPINPGSAQGAGAQLPSESNLLMALADMHAQGRVPQSDNGDRTSASHNVARIKGLPSGSPSGLTGVRKR